jgi:hypothetical protein
VVCVCLVRDPVPLGDDHGLEVLALGHLRLDVGDEIGQVRDVLQHVSIPNMLRPVICLPRRAWSTRPWAEADGSWITAAISDCTRYGSNRSRYLHGAAQSVDAVVGVLGLQALEGGLHDVVPSGSRSSAL